MSKAGKSSSIPQFKFKGYVNITIAESHDTELKRYIADTDKVFADLAQVLIDGYNVKNNYDTEKLNHRCSLTGYHLTGDNFGYVIGAFAEDWYTALAVVLYLQRTPPRCFGVSARCS